MHATEKLHTYLLGSHGMVCIGVVKLLDVSYDYSSAASLPSILTTSVVCSREPVIIPFINRSAARTTGYGTVLSFWCKECSPLFVNTVRTTLSPHVSMLMEIAARSRRSVDRAASCASRHSITWLRSHATQIDSELDPCAYWDMQTKSASLSDLLSHAGQ